MRYNQLGKSELFVSEISFGCMSLESDDKANKALLGHAIAHGINFFDTADMYEKGLNETTLGKAFKGIRHQVIIATKVGNQWRADGSGWDWNPSSAYIFKSINESLKRLQTDYIDLYQLHGGTINDPMDETIDAFEILRKQGKIRCYGISSIRPNVIHEYVKRSKIESVMMQYSILDRRPEETCLELIKEQHIGVLARGTLAKGLLAGKPATEYLNYTAHEVEAAQKTIQSLENRSDDEVAIRFVLRDRVIASAVVGIRTLDHLNRCIEIANKPILTPVEMATVENALKINHYLEHR